MLLLFVGYLQKFYASSFGLALAECVRVSWFGKKPSTGSRMCRMRVARSCSRFTVSCFCFNFFQNNHIAEHFYCCSFASWCVPMHTTLLLDNISFLLLLLLFSRYIWSRSFFYEIFLLNGISRKSTSIKCDTYTMVWPPEMVYTHLSIQMFDRCDFFINLFRFLLIRWIVIL